jgi:hypothetical protein
MPVPQLGRRQGTPLLAYRGAETDATLSAWYTDNPVSRRRVAGLLQLQLVRLDGRTAAVRVEDDSLVDLGLPRARSA